MSKKPNYKVRLAILCVCSFLVTILPLLICFIVNWDKYARTQGETMKLCAGGILCVIFIGLKVLGKLKMPREIVTLTILFIMAYLLKALLNDLVLLLGMALIGAVLDSMFFQKAIKRTRENILIAKTADVTTAQVEEVMKKYLGGSK